MVLKFVLFGALTLSQISTKTLSFKFGTWVVNQVYGELLSYFVDLEPNFVLSEDHTGDATFPILLQ